MSSNSQSSRPVLDLKKLSDHELHEATRLASHKERQATLALLEHLAEVDQRRLYSARGYATLWEYVHKFLGYSEAQASERVSAMRLMKRIPEVREKLESQALTLTGAAKLASFVRRERCSEEKTLSLLSRISHQPVRHAERILISEQKDPGARPDVVRPSSLELTRISFDADSELMAMLEELKNLQGHPEWSMNDRLKSALRIVLDKRKGKHSDPVLRAPEVKEKVAPRAKGRTASTQPRRGKPSSGRGRSRYIPVSVRRETERRSKRQCEYVDPETKRRCEGRFDLQLDHRTPYAKGGASTTANIRHLCANHNRFVALREFGQLKMKPYFR